MAQIVYVLCALTSLACALLLFRAYARNKVRLLLWCAFCFTGMTLSNVMLILDVLVFTNVDLWQVRAFSGMLSMCLLVFGLIWDS